MNVTNSPGLPNEVLLQICRYLDKESLISFGQTSSLCRSISEEPSLWKSCFLKPKTSEDVTCLNKRIEWFQYNETNYKKTYLEYLKIFCICSKNYTDINLEIHPNANLFRIKSIIETQLENANDYINNDAISQALQRRASLETIQLLIDNGAKLFKGFFNALSEALKYHAPLETIQLLLDNDAKLNSNVLTEALEYHAPLETVQFLLNKGVEKPNNILLSAIEHQASIQIIQLLLDKDAKAFNRILFNILREALKYHASLEIIQLFLDNGAKIPDDILFYALTYKASPETIQFLEEAIKQTAIPADHFLEE